MRKCGQAGGDSGVALDPGEKTRFVGSSQCFSVTPIGGPRDEEYRSTQMWQAIQVLLVLICDDSITDHSQ